MGLSAFASRRHPHVVVMAPALTESGQTQSFTELLEACDLRANPKRISQDIRIKVYNLALEESLKRPNGTTPKRNPPLRPLDVVPSGGDSSMNCGSPMGDQSENMGLLKSSVTCPPCGGQENLPALPLMKVNDLEQVLADLPAANVDELIRAISTMDSEAVEGSEGVDGSDTVDTPEFVISTAELANFEKELLLSAEEVMSGFTDEVLPEPAPDARLTLTQDKEEEEWKRHFVLQRQHSRLLRRIKKLEARELAKAAAAELKAVLEHAYRLARPATPQTSQPPTTSPEPDHLAAFVSQLHCVAHNPAQSAARFRASIRYFGSGSAELPPSTDPVPGSLLPKLPLEDREALKAVSWQLGTQLGLADSQLDSDATDSSSGGDSCDESVNYNNHLRNFMSIKKRAYWRWHQDRSAVASRWTWLTSQITDLDFRIRQLTDHHRKHRAKKGPVVLREEVATASVAVNGYHGALPGGPPVKVSDAAGPNGTLTDPTATSTCSRTRPYLQHEFRKRKLVRTGNLHLRSTSAKALRPASLRCWCVRPAHCLLCTGRADATQPAGGPALGALSVQDRVAALDPAYHPVLSFPNDVPLTLHLDSVMRLHEWQARANRCSYKYNKYNKYDKYHKDKGNLPRLRKDKQVVDHKRKMHKHATALLSAKLLKKKLSVGRKRRDLKHAELGSMPIMPTIPPLRIRKARKVSSLSGGESGEEELYVAATPVESGSESGAAVMGCSEREGGRERRIRGDSFDINNIVIPYSMAASTRVEMLQYKEIPTPKWRRVEEPSEEGSGRGEETEEDVSDEAVLERHVRCEDAERRKFMSYIKLPLVARGRANRRTDSRAESSGANTPDPMSPMAPEHGESPLTTPPATPLAPHTGDDIVNSGIGKRHAGDDAVSSSVGRRRTISSSRGMLRDKLERAAANTASANNDPDRCLTPDPEDEVAPYEPRSYPLKTDEYQRMAAQMPPEVPPSPAFTYQLAPSTPQPATPLTPSTLKESASTSDGERAAYHCDTLPESPSCSSTISALEEGEEPDDPNDPEWQAVDEDEDEYRSYRSRR